MMMRKIIFFFLLGLPFALSSQSYIPQYHDPRFHINPIAPLQVYAFDLKDVSLLKGSAFYKARSLDSAYMMELDAGRLLARFYENAGIHTDKKPYGGWESDGLSGHTLGHYLSAMSMLYASTGNEKIKERIDNIVSELHFCQIRRKSGYVGAIPGEDSIFYKVSKDIIHSGGFDLNGGWSPWYTVHKLMSGLLDAYLYTGNQEALQIDERMAEWTLRILSPLSDASIKRMLQCEYGGMNDVLALLFAVSGNQNDYKASDLFFDDFVMLPLSRRVDALQFKHANTNIPKGVGAANRYIYGGASRDSIIAQFMWRIIKNYHSYANGGNGNYEYFGAESKLSERLSDDNSETCATYNILKLSSLIFCWHPTSDIMDFYEKGMINDILASQNHQTGMMCYFLPLRMGGQKSFSDEFNTFTCCVGTGMESHVKYNQAIYYHSSNDKLLYVNLFIPSRLWWKTQKTSILMTGSPLNNDTIHLRIYPNERNLSFILKLRKPSWAKSYHVLINGKSCLATLGNDGYVNVSHLWKYGDLVTYILPRTLRAESMPDNLYRQAFFYGPVLLAGDLNNSKPFAPDESPVLVSNHKTISPLLKMKDAQRLLFVTNHVARPHDVLLRPLYEMDSSRYCVYWDLFTDSQWKQKKKEYIQEREINRQTEAMTIDFFRIGEMQPERDHSFKASSNSYVSQTLGRYGREVRSGGKMEFLMRLDSSSSCSLQFSYLGADRNRKFDIYLDGKFFLTENLGDQYAEDKFYAKTYKIPESLIAGKSVVRVSIIACHASTAGRIFGVRILHNKK